MALTDNLISYWKLDESSGNANDSHGSNDLTNNNSTAYAAAKINNGVDLESTASNSLTISDASQSGLDIASDFSVSFWIKLESTGANSVIFSKWASTSNQRSYALFVNSSNLLVLYISPDGTNAATSKITVTNSALSNGTFYHIALSYNATTGSVISYINGSANLTSGGHVNSIYNSTSQFSLGHYSEDFAYFDGIIDEFAIWNKIIPSGEVTSLYNAGNGLTYPFGVSFIPKISII